MKATHTPPTIASVEPTPADVLRAAAVYLERYDWAQGEFFARPNPAGSALFQPACAVGAICAAATGRSIAALGDIPSGPDGYLVDRALHLLASYLDGSDVESGAADLIADWNDEQGRTLVDVILALTDAARDWDRHHPRGGESS
ncbi:DUF6197 family protein [Solwaraspora sp. WMMB762]|uniref:DUF6197 family protein n=1 Tax=Solwaraspora sp. WMMB762 TaxID=3404120 RepID=UPI003B922F8A